MTSQTAEQQRAAPKEIGRKSQSVATLFIGDLAPNTQEQHLFQLFRRAGNVASLRVVRDTRTHESDPNGSCYAYVNFYSFQHAQTALELFNQTKINGRVCRIMHATRERKFKDDVQGNLFVKNIDPDVKATAFYDTFGLFGKILSCKLEYDAEGKSLGYGYIHYENPAEAELAMNTANGMYLLSKRLYVARHMKKEDRTRNPNTHFSNIYFKNIPPIWTENDIVNFFGQIGKTNSVILNTSNPRGNFGFINFENGDDAKRAVELLNGAAITKDGLYEPVGREGSEDHKTFGDMGEDGVTGDSATVNEEEAEAEAEAAAGNNLNSEILPPQGADQAENTDDCSPEVESTSQDGQETNKTVTDTRIADSSRLESQHNEVVGDECEPGNTEGNEESASATAEEKVSVDTDEIQVADKEPDTPAVPEEPQVYHIYVARAQAKSERVSELRKQFAESKPAVKTQRPHNNSVVVKLTNLPPSMTSDDLRSILTKYGKVYRVYIFTEQRGESRQVGLVTVRNKETADSIVEAYDEVEIDGRIVSATINVNARTHRRRRQPGSTPSKQHYKNDITSASVATPAVSGDQSEIEVGIIVNRLQDMDRQGRKDFVAARISAEYPEKSADAIKISESLLSSNDDAAIAKMLIRPEALKNEIDYIVQDSS